MLSRHIYHRKKSQKSDSVFAFLIKKKGETETAVVDSLFIAAPIGCVFCVRFLFCYAVLCVSFLVL